MPGPVTTLTKRRLYCSRFLARPLGVFFLSCLATWEEEKKRGFEGACVWGEGMGVEGDGTFSLARVCRR